MAQIALENVSKVYPDGTLAVADLSLEVQDGEFMVFVGPSGCGKTSALRMIAGLEEISGGTVRIGDAPVNDLPPKSRDVAMIFQNYALYPHMDSYANMAFGLKMRGIDRAEIDRRVRHAARVLGLEDVLGKKPRTLSGGQRQRVAMGRAIVREPRAFLMDEPLSNLDAKLRVQMRAEIARIQRDLAVTTIYVTHDQSEAMTLGDRVAVMRKGELQQLEPPQILYRNPVNLFVAEFIGSPAMNLVEATIADGVARFGSHTLPVRDRPALGRYEGRKVALGIRPEDLEDAALTSAPPEARLPVSVDLREDMGAEIFLHLAVDAPPVSTAEVREAFEDAEMATALEQQAARVGTPFIARVGRESTAREDERIEIAVDTRMLHFFDLDTGAAISE
ncbi:MAG: multiple sugar transport system ATP-binding protein [Gaiellaceae bacterium]|nr:multiple sugar transport system ATP-binding protein [Gaiellaceae bacterium]